MIALAALALAAAAEPVPTTFDLADYDQVRRRSVEQDMRQRYRAPDADPPQADVPDISLRWRLTKVKLRMALDLPY